MSTPPDAGARDWVDVCGRILRRSANDWGRGRGVSLRGVLYFGPAPGEADYERSLRSPELSRPVRARGRDVCAEQHGFRCTFVSEKPARRVGNVELIQYKVGGGATRQNHYCSRTFENAIWHCGAVYDALKARPDIRPDLIVGHAGFGSTLFLRELYSCPIINYFEYFYRTVESDMDFRREFPLAARKRLRAGAQCHDPAGPRQLRPRLQPDPLAARPAAAGVPVQGPRDLRRASTRTCGVRGRACRGGSPTAPSRTTRGSSAMSRGASSRCGVSTSS